MWDVKYRPKTFSDVLGQNGTVQVLKSRLCKGTALDTSYIFSGSHGCGKTTLSRILGRALLCQDLQEGEPCNECDNCQSILSETSMAFAELDAASRGTIDNIRHIVDDLDFVTVGAAKRIYVVDECHRMSRDAQDVLLKPLEDKRLVAIFCTTEPAKIRGTIRSRCEEYPIRKITREDILTRMKGILEQEGVAHEDNAVLTVIDHCGGHVRDVLNRLEMIAQIGDVSIDVVREYLELGLVSTYYQVLLSLGQPARALPMVDDACDRVGVENVCAGLAEAAMNSYRLAHDMFVEFTYVDQDLAKKVYAVYGDEVVRLAEYFLQRRFHKVSLVCDVIRCAAGVPVQVETSATPPVKVHACGPAPALEASPKTTTVSDTQSVEKPISESPKPQETPEPPKPPKPPKPQETLEPPKLKPTVKSSKPLVRGDGIGDVPENKVGNSPTSGDAKNWSDPFAATSMDRKAVPKKQPRGGGGQKEPKIRFMGTRDKSYLDEPIPTEKWAMEFRTLYLGRGG